jgi:hypothetical protein
MTASLQTRRIANSKDGEATMLHLNAIFQAEGLNPNLVQLIRHTDKKRFQKEEKSLWDVWYSERERFAKYQSVQGQKNKFDVGGVVASFIVSNSDETLFVGLYRVQSRRNWTAGDYCDPLWEVSSENDFVHDLHATEQMCDYASRLVIEPWPDVRTLVKRAAQYDAKVLEIKRTPDQEQFPTLMKFRKRVGDLPNIPHSWHVPLKEAKGIYLLTFADGQHYVGSASGEEGFWQRWSDYVRTGNGGNRVLIREKRDARKDATVSILEVTGSALTRQEIINREMNWQIKLGWRAKRLDEE